MFRRRDCGRRRTGTELRLQEQTQSIVARFGRRRRNPGRGLLQGGDGHVRLTILQGRFRPNLECDHQFHFSLGCRDGAEQGLDRRVQQLQCALGYAAAQVEAPGADGGVDGQRRAGVVAGESRQALSGTAVGIGHGGGKSLPKFRVRFQGRFRIRRNEIGQRTGGPIKKAGVEFTNGGIVRGALGCGRHDGGIGGRGRGGSGGSGGSCRDGGGDARRSGRRDDRHGASRRGRHHRRFGGNRSLRLGGQAQPAEEAKVPPKSHRQAEGWRGTPGFKSVFGRTRE